MTRLENYLSLARRTGFESVPISYSLCPSLWKRFEAYLSLHPMEIPFAEGSVPDLPASHPPAEEILAAYYTGKTFRPGTGVDAWGVAHEPGSSAAFHMTYMHHPMESFDSVEQIQAYRFPSFDPAGLAVQSATVADLHRQDRAAAGYMQCTVWETAWYLRGMENLFCDMQTDPDMADALLTRVTDLAVQRAESFARAGVDVLFLGDDIGMQHTIMMSPALYGEWLRPRLARVIDAARAIKPDILVFYHSCGHVTELVPQLIEAGIDVLDPVQPECMPFREIHDRFGDKLSFHGTLGTQSTMPFGTPDDVRRVVFENLDIAGPHGGLFVCPTHLLEPEVPVENVVAYIQACLDYGK